MTGILIGECDSASCAMNGQMLRGLGMEIPSSAEIQLYIASVKSHHLGVPGFQSAATAYARQRNTAGTGERREERGETLHTGGLTAGRRDLSAVLGARGAVLGSVGRDDAGGLEGARQQDALHVHQLAAQPEERPLRVARLLAHAAQVHQACDAEAIRMYPSYLAQKLDALRNHKRERQRERQRQRSRRCIFSTGQAKVRQACNIELRFFLLAWVLGFKGQALCFGAQFHLRLNSDDEFLSFCGMKAQYCQPDQLWNRPSRVQSLPSSNKRSRTIAEHNARGTQDLQQLPARQLARLAQLRDHLEARRCMRQ